MATRAGAGRHGRAGIDPERAGHPDLSISDGAGARPQPQPAPDFRLESVVSLRAARPASVARGRAAARPGGRSRACRCIARGTQGFDARRTACGAVAAPAPRELLDRRQRRPACCRTGASPAPGSHPGQRAHRDRGVCVAAAGRPRRIGARRAIAFLRGLRRSTHEGRPTSARRRWRTSSSTDGGTPSSSQPAAVCIAIG